MSDRTTLHARARRGVNLPLYWVVRLTFQPFFHAYFGLRRKGMGHVPRSGPVIFAANHRSFVDPFFIGTLVRRPSYFISKKELFDRRIAGWFINALGGFPVDRGHSDGDAMDTARGLLRAGHPVVIFPEGTRVRNGGLGSTKRGVGRLALETGAPIVPIAIVGSERLRRKWRIRPGRVRMLVGAPIHVTPVDEPTPEAAEVVVQQVWAQVQLQWEWLGGAAPIRRAAVLGDGAAGSALADLLERGGSAVTTTAERWTDLVVACGSAAEIGNLLEDAELPDHAVVLVAATEETDAVARIADWVGDRPLVALGAALPPDRWSASDARLTIGSRDITAAHVVSQSFARAGVAAEIVTDPEGLVVPAESAIRQRVSSGV